jgi:hypothetical protein
MDVYEDALGLLRGHRVPFESYQASAPKPSVDRKPTHVSIEIRRREKKRQKTVAHQKAGQPPPSPDRTLVRSSEAADAD